MLPTICQGTAYLLFGTGFLYKNFNFTVNHSPNATGKVYQVSEKTALKARQRFFLIYLSHSSFVTQNKYGYRGDKYISMLNKKEMVENNNKLFDVEDSTRSYRDPLSYW